ncbi:PP2C family protein-serine/threonine phosphatase [candidate division KSB1 bacterium]|nr:PP2C family protein-serine/threonine phosphatase [candidate division KSB1 bacterium]
MISHTEFYRKLDAMLVNIDHLEEKKDYLFSILKRLEQKFGENLHFAAGRLYEEEATEFYLLEMTATSTAHLQLPSTLPLESSAVQLVLRHGCYIYDVAEVSLATPIFEPERYAIPVAIAIQGSEKRWLLIFELRSGWIREELEFCFNIVRRALEFKLSYEAIKSNLISAAKIQQSLLPRKVLAIPGFQIAARSKPAELVGGDLYDFFDFEFGTFGVAIGDAAGHDLPAALLVRDVVTGLRMGIEKEFKITYAIRKLNRVIHRSTYSSAFVTLFYSEIECDGSMFYVNAGHPPPLLVHEKTVHLLEANGQILGPLPEITLQRAYTFIPPNGVLVLYTDGLFERRNLAGENFSIDRLKQLVLEHQYENADALLQLVFENVYRFGAGQPWEDDVTLVVIKRVSPN